MKKRAIGVVLVAALMLAGCGSSNEKTISNQSQTTGSAAESTNESTSAYEGYVFEANGVSVEVDGDFSRFEEGLGEKADYYEAPSCAFGDLDKVHSYGAFEVDTYQTEGVDYVSAVILLNDSVSTPEGLCIGDSADKVTELYGEAASSDDTQMTYEKGGMKLVILLKDGTVSTIEYLSKILD